MVKAMRIGIDASRAFGEQRTGTEEYSYQIIKHLLALPQAREHEWILYVRPNLKFLNQTSFALSRANFKFQIINLPYLWTQLGLAARTWVDKLDVLWIPAHTLPVVRQAGLRTVVTIHGLEYEWLPEYSNWLQAWYLPLSTQYAVLSAGKIIAVSEFTKWQLVERLEAEEKKISVIHEGVSRTGLHPAHRGEQPYLLFIGTIQPRKNLQRLIEAFAILKSQIPNLNLKLVIAGKLGWMYDEVLAAPKKWGVEDKVVFTGYINEAERNSLLRNARVYVQPSITEGFGLPVLEAMVFGVPVVSSQGGALKEIINIHYPMSNKILFDPYDVKDMVDKISLVLRDQRLRKEMIIAGRKLKFSWDEAAERTYKILNSKF